MTRTQHTFGALPRPRTTARAALAAVLLAAAPGCAGLIDGASGPMEESDRVVTGIEVGQGFTKRLTRTQYDNAVSDLFGQELKVSQAIPGDDNTIGYAVGRTLSAAHVEAYFTAAESVARTVTENLDAILPCSAASLDETCLRAFIDDVGVRAFRRPLSDDEVAGLLGAYDTIEAAYGAREGIEVVIARLLASPHFVYQVEQNPSGAKPGAVVKLSAHEVATRMAFLLWDSGPDRELIDAATDGKLDTKEGILAEAERLLADPRAQRGFHDFSRQWLLTSKLDGLEKAATPEWNDALARDMRASMDAFVDEVVWQSRGGLRELLSAPFAYVTPGMAPLVGVDTTGDDAMARVSSLPNHAGLLTQPALLAVTTHGGDSNAILRGKFVRERLLCDTLGDPPANVPQLEEKQPGETSRERFARHTSDPACSGCHQLMDPIGFGFEHYDGLGRFREDDNGESIEDSGEIISGDDASGAFEGTEGLADKLAGSERANTCVAKQLFRYAMGRPETNKESASIQQIRDAGAPEDHAIRALLLGVVTADSFLHRVIPTEEP